MSGVSVRHKAQPLARRRAKGGSCIADWFRPGYQWLCPCPAHSDYAPQGFQATCSCPGCGNTVTDSVMCSECASGNCTHG
jgi:hypothetical protein